MFIGFGFSVIGGVTMIAYMNLILVGHGFDQYLVFIIDRWETYLFFGGLLLIFFSIYLPYRK